MSTEAAMETDNIHHKQLQEPTQEDKETLQKTIYGLAANEPLECQMAIAFVPLNRARQNLAYFGGNSITNVCKKDGQFAPWNGVQDVEIKNWELYMKIGECLPDVLSGRIEDNTYGSDHVLPEWEQPEWLKNVVHKATYGHFKFYKSKWLD